MNRAERRRKERSELKKCGEKNKNIKGLDPYIGALINHFMDETQAKHNYSIDALLTCFALTELRLYGFKQKRIMKSLNYCNGLCQEIAEDLGKLKEFKKELEDVAKVTIK